MAQYLDHLDQTVRRLRMRMPTPAVIELLVPTSVVRERLTARRQCSTCGTVYNLRDHPPAHADTCDHDGMFWFRRSDDKDQAILNRPRIYEQMIGPLSDYCKARWDYQQINGSQHPGMIAGLVLRRPRSITAGNHKSQCALICLAQS